MTSLVRRTASTKPPAGGGFKFQYKARTAEQVKERARQTSGRDSYIASDVQFFTPAEGANTIRILPPPPEVANEWAHYGMRVWEHRDIGVDKGAYLCLAKMKNEPCPVCEDRERASSAGEKDLAWSLKPQCKTLVYVINRKDEAKGPLLWNISAGGKKSMDTDLLNLCVDPSDGSLLHVDDPDQGFDLSLTRTGTGLTTAYSGKSFSRRASPLSDLPERYEQWLRYVTEHRIDTKLVWFDYDYILHALQGQPAPENTGGDDKPQSQQQSQQQQERAPLQRRGSAATPPPQEQQQNAGEDAPPSWDDLKGMDEAGLEMLVDYYKLVPPEKGFEAKGADGNDDLREWIARELGIEIPKALAASSTGGAKPSWKTKLNEMKS